MKKGLITFYLLVYACICAYLLVEVVLGSALEQNQTIQKGVSPGHVLKGTIWTKDKSESITILWSSVSLPDSLSFVIYKSSTDSLTAIYRREMHP